MNEGRVLIVDDEPKLVETLVERLRNRGFAAAGADNGQAALEYLEGSLVDVVILDVMMKGMNGLEVLREIKDRWPQVQTIMLTGHASVESGLRGLRLGAFDYLIKPAPLDELIRKINQAMERKNSLPPLNHDPS
ncbi:MAG: response regulator [Desulfovibrionales bacterium]